MIPYVMIPLALAAVVVDLGFAPGAALFGARPSLTLALVGSWSALRPQEEAMVLAPAAGLFLGLLGTEPFGTSVLALVPFVLLGALERPRTPGRRVLFTVAVVIAGTIAYAAVYAVVARMRGAAVPFGLAALRVDALVALLNGALAAVLYWPLARTAPTAPVHNDLRRH